MSIPAPFDVYAVVILLLLQAVILWKYNILRKENVQLKGVAELDPLTQILNRRSFFEKGEEYLNSLSGGSERRQGNQRKSVCGIMLDLDFFKSLNDSYGHAFGDKVLREVAGLVKRLLREEDDIFGRYGGEEFVILLGDGSDAIVVADKLREAIEKLPLYTKAGRRVEVTASLGIACEVQYCPLEELFERADKALYKAKEKGRNMVVAG